MTQETTQLSVAQIQEEVTRELANADTLKLLVATTFKGLNPEVLPQAIMEGMIRGLTFKDFLEKNVYAIPYGQGYSLVTSIDHARKIGMRSGVVGKTAPVFTEVNGKVDACTVTVKRKVGDEIGEFTETVYFSEYTTGRNLWLSKPRTMLAKVAEMHALRMACPEELSQAYVEEEMTKEVKPKPATDLAPLRAKIAGAKSLDALKAAWATLPADARPQLWDEKEARKVALIAELNKTNETAEVSGQ